VAKYKVTFNKSSRKELELLPKHILSKILLNIDGLESEPRPRSAKKIVGSVSDYRIRVGDYRLLFEVDDIKQDILIYRIGHRKEVYRNL
jgi:mRNA interferase RelE/StbE